MGKALYRKYRSKKLGDVVGQDHITKTLDNTLKSGKVSHAYLFTGPRGVGKTSVARILASEVNKIPYDEENQHLDIIEIDAASNRRIDEIRDLKEKVNISPSTAKYKVYIIDEVHMLTKEAFNALLKTLEEPPSHAIFILATTEAHKLPDTIISRTQRFSFKPIQDDDAVKHLKNIARAEKISISEEALELIAKYGDGSFRDSISLLDQVSNNSKYITVDDVQNLLGIAPSHEIDKTIDIIESRNAGDLLSHLGSMKLQGFSAATLAKQLGEHYRNELLNLEIPKKEILDLLSSLLTVQISSRPEDKLELVLLEFLLNNSPAQISSEQDKVPTKSKKTTSKEKSETPKNVNSDWQSIMDSIKQQHNTLYGTLRMADASLSDNILTLSFKFAFHKKRLDDAKNMDILNKTLKKITNKNITVKCIVDNKRDEDMNKKATPKGIETISNIFGAAERL